MTEKIEEFVKAQHFRAFVFNNDGLIMMVQKNSRLDIPFGQLTEDDEDLEAAVRRVVFSETKTALDPIVPVTLVNEKCRDGNEIPTVILAARTNGEAQIQPDEKTWHRFVMEATFSLQSGYGRNDIKKLLESARFTLTCEEIKMDREEATKCGTEKYNINSKY